jgi:tetratricopeptide (TPR) repeat protein
MYELNELEKKWIAYRRQKLRKYTYLLGAFLAVAFVSSVASLFFLGHKTVDANSTQQPPLEQNASLQTKLEPTIQTPITTHKEIVIVSPQENIQSFQSMQPTKEQEVLQQQQQVAAQQQTIVQKPKVQPKIFIETKNVNHLEFLEDRQNKNPDINNALALATEYYKSGEYAKTLKWAMNANSQDSKNEKSWMLFAKASYKLGRKQDAINALEKFNQTSPSDNVKTLINQIKNNEL